jgi:two-component system response regulator AgrA
LDDIFFQTHRSFVVNVSNVASVDRTANMVFFEGDESCLLSRTRKKEFLERLKDR